MVAPASTASFDSPAQEVDIGAARVFGGKLNFRAMLSGVTHVSRDGFESLFPRHAEFVM